MLSGFCEVDGGFTVLKNVFVWADLMSSQEFMRICTHMCALLQYKTMFEE